MEAGVEVEAEVEAEAEAETETEEKEERERSLRPPDQNLGQDLREVRGRKDERYPMGERQPQGRGNVVL